MKHNKTLRPYPKFVCPNVTKYFNSYEGVGTPCAEKILQQRILASATEAMWNLLSLLQNIHNIQETTRTSCGKQAVKINQMSSIRMPCKKTANAISAPQHDQASNLWEQEQSLLSRKNQWKKETTSVLPFYTLEESSSDRCPLLW